jgi:hypothetical protein
MRLFFVVVILTSFVQLIAQLEVADSCNTRLTSLKKEGAGQLSEIEQMQSQLHRAQQDKEKLMAQMHHEQQNAQVDHSKLEQPNNNIGGQDLQKQRFDNGGGNLHQGGGEGDRGVRDRRDEGNFGGGRSLRDQGVNNWRDGLRGIGNQEDHLQRIDNRFQNPGARGDFPGIGNRGDQYHGIGNQNGQYRGIGNQNDQLHGLGNRDDHYQDRDRQLRGVAKESFDDFRISDEQKQSVFDSLQGKLARGEKLDDRQMKILQLLSKDFQIGERKSHNIVREEDKNNVPIRNEMELENLHQEQQRELVDHEREERDGLEGDKPKEEDQLPNPLDENEEVKDIIEEEQKRGEFDNLGNDRKFDFVDRDQEEPVGAGGEELKQVVVAKEEGDRKENEKEEDGGRQEDHEERELHKDERLEDLEKEGKERERDNPLPRPIQKDANLDDEDDYPGAKKDKVEVKYFKLS